MMRRLYQILVMCLLLAACEADNKYNTYYPCNFVFNASLYPTSALTRALSNPGEFVIVRPETQQGVVHLKLTPNHGTWAESDVDLTMSTAIDNERQSYASMGAGRGLVIGRSNFFGLKAYDLQCPNCLKESGVSRYPLQWTDGGRYLECKQCKRIYDPDNDVGIVVANGQKGDEMLIQYRYISYNEAEGRLYVHN